MGVSETPDKQESWQDIIATVDRLEGWGSRLLVYLKPVRLATVIHDPNRLIHEVLVLPEHAMQERQLQAVVDLEPLPAVEVDVIWMEQALASIMTNAVEASPSGSEIDLKSSPTAQGVCIAIRDEGQGVPNLAGLASDWRWRKKWCPPTAGRLQSKVNLGLGPK